jgi:gentisate 1,2-dioxygenase
MASDACSKCAGPLDTSGYPLWCRKCRAAHKREYETVRKDLLESKGFVAGREAMRDVLAREFDAQGSGKFTGTEAARLILNAPGPTVGD